MASGTNLSARLQPNPKLLELIISRLLILFLRLIFLLSYDRPDDPNHLRYFSTLYFYPRLLLRVVYIFVFAFSFTTWHHLAFTIIEPMGWGFFFFFFFFFNFFFFFGSHWLTKLVNLDDIDLVKDMPVSLQVVGGRFGEEQAVSVAKVLDKLMN